MKKQRILIKLITVYLLFSWGCAWYMHRMAMEAYFARALDQERMETDREAAAEALILLGRPAADFLVTKLFAGTFSERALAAGLLGRVGEEAVEPLCRALPKLQGGKRALALEALGNTGAGGVFDLIAPYASDENWRVRLRAFRALHGLSGQGKKRVFMEAVSDHSPFVRLEGIKFIREGRPSGSTGMLVSFLKDESYIVRFEAASALASFIGKPSLSLEEILGCASPVEKLALIETFERMPSESAEPFLKSLLDDVDWSVRGYAARTLGETGGKALIPVLGERLEKEENIFVRNRIEEALTRISQQMPGGQYVPDSGHDSNEGEREE